MIKKDSIRTHTFLIQTKRETVVPMPLDFIFHLEQAIDYHEWFYQTHHYGKIYSDTVDDITRPECIIPVGTVEFVCDYFKAHYGNVPKPWNVPESLFLYAKRKIKNNELPMGDVNFVKSNDTIKEINNGAHNKDNPYTVGDNFQASEIVDDIQSEWRGFVFNGELLDIRSYSGEFDVFPDMIEVRSMIKDFTDSPEAYTIDVGVSPSRGTFLIEVHDFFSCGLYGFERYDLLPIMLCRCYYNLVKKLS